LDRAPSHTGTIQFFRVFGVSCSKRTRNQKSERKLERRARKIGSRDFDPHIGPRNGKLDHETGDPKLAHDLDSLFRTLGRTLDFRGEPPTSQSSFLIQLFGNETFPVPIFDFCPTPFPDLPNPFPPRILATFFSPLSAVAPSNFHEGELHLILYI
jgi:hypothetical protein